MYKLWHDCYFQLTFCFTVKREPEKVKVTALCKVIPEDIKQQDILENPHNWINLLMTYGSDRILNMFGDDTKLSRAADTTEGP